MTRAEKRRGSWYLAGGVSLACAMLLGIPARRRQRGWRMMLGGLLLLVPFCGGVVSCGGGANGGGGSGTPGTTAGSYQITVTGTSGATTASGSVTLTVQ
jgi:hypothetical protein